MRWRRAVPASTRRQAGAAWIAGVVVVVELVAATGFTDRLAGAWLSACRGAPTAAERRNNGIDLKASTHQWLASRAIAILTADGHDRIVRFLATPDPTAPPARGGGTETYGYRRMWGAAAADCSLYHLIPDHLHNFWSHRGRRMIVGSSAASYAETAFTNATTAWNQGDRAQAMIWLGASLHLVQDACVPQHNFFGIGVNHTPYERWVRTHQNALAVGDGAILVGTFRATDGHGGPEWSSQHPRGWTDECAHRAARVIRPAFADVPKPSTSADPQWKTAAHVADTQRLGAGYVEFFFQKVGAA
jgi:phospholipase C